MINHKCSEECDKLKKVKEPGGDKLVFTIPVCALVKYSKVHMIRMISEAMIDTYDKIHHDILTQEN